MSTKTTFKRIALVAVAALGLGTIGAPAFAANTFRAAYTAPATLDLLAGYSAGDVGTIQINFTEVAGAAGFATADTATVTITANDGAATATDVAFLAALTIDDQSTSVTGTTAAAASASNDFNFASTGYNALNNATVTNSTNKKMDMSPTAAGFTTATGRAYLKVAAGLTAAATGAKVRYTLTVSADGRVETFSSLLTLTIGTKAGTATVPVATGIVNAGATVTATHTQPYTNVVAGGSISPTVFAITDTIATGDPVFDVTAVVTGGSATMVRTNATTITPTLLKNALTGALSVTYTITVTVPTSALSGETVSVYGYTWTVQPYTPAYSYSAVTESMNSNGYYEAKSAGGDGIVHASASTTAGQTATISVVQKDQNGTTISASAYAKTVTATVTGKGSLAALGANGEVTKVQTWTSVLGNLAGTTTINVFPEGTSGEGTLVITVDGATAATYSLRFFGAAASVSATLIRPIGNAAGDTNGVVGSVVTGAALAGVTTADAVITTVTAIAVTVKDANGYAIPTSLAPAAVVSDRSVVSTATRTLTDSGVGIYSAGTFVQHYSYTTNANTSGKTSTITFTYLNTAGVLLSTTPVTVTLGGAVVKASISFGTSSSFTPGQQLTITFSGLDASGNKAYDGQNLIAGGFDSTLDFGGANDTFQLGSYWTTASIVNGVKARITYAPTTLGEWKLLGYLADGTEFSATAKVEGGAAADATSAAADAAAEATDAANAATDAANAAAEAADAATAAAQDAADAVAALSTQVSEMVNALKKQITALTNLVIKIQKKVKA